VRVLSPPTKGRIYFSLLDSPEYLCEWRLSSKDLVAKPIRHVEDGRLISLRELPCQDRDWPFCFFFRRIFLPGASMIVTCCGSCRTEAPVILL